MTLRSDAYLGAKDIERIVREMLAFQSTLNDKKSADQATIDDKRRRNTRNVHLLTTKEEEFRTAIRDRNEGKIRTLTLLLGRMRETNDRDKADIEAAEAALSAHVNDLAKFTSSLPPLNALVKAYDEAKNSAARDFWKNNSARAFVGADVAAGAVEGVMSAVDIGKKGIKASLGKFAGRPEIGVQHIAPIIGPALQLLKSAGDYVAETRAGVPPANPLLSHTGDSPLTKDYLLARIRKTTGGQVISAAGGAGSIVLSGGMVNAGSAVVHINAGTSTLVHVSKLNKIIDDFSNNPPNAGVLATLSAHTFNATDIRKRAIQAAEQALFPFKKNIELVIQLKKIKAGIRGAETVGACVPLGSFFSAAAAAAKIYFHASHTRLAHMAAMLLHYHAYNYVNQTPKPDAASYEAYAYKIFKELLTRRGATRVFGQYQVDEMIKEPAGWQVLSDKILSS